jgi:hypothetical protein
MGNLIRPDHPKGTGQPAQTTAGALLHIEGRALSNFMQCLCETGHGAIRFLAMMAEYGNRGIIASKMHIDVPAATVHALAGHLAGPTPDASADINVNRHFNPSG